MPGLHMVGSVTFTGLTMRSNGTSLMALTVLSVKAKKEPNMRYDCD